MIGVIPEALARRGVAHSGLSELLVTATMHERKARMAELSESVVALPGGLGTLEELFEILTWNQLGFCAKPFGLVNAAGYFDRLLAHLDHAVAERFLHPAHRAMLVCGDSAPRLLDALEAVETPVVVEKWFDHVSVPRRKPMKIFVAALCLLGASAAPQSDADCVGTRDDWLARRVGVPPAPRGVRRRHGDDSERRRHAEERLEGSGRRAPA